MQLQATQTTRVLPHGQQCLRRARLQTTQQTSLQITPHDEHEPTFDADIDLACMRFLKSDLQLPNGQKKKHMCEVTFL